ncbi:histone-like nucleoid-structuring protein Lsr2 [Corynebacterium uberis]|uniref:histone-like nucleoid-structuring protein Lsr2 n=1 Tax=Corynebacterium TaxID=1716 RepID=UPI001D0AECE2|nr:MULTISPECIES: Lsr2 family protein [Corynebacterium]MCZ9309564.1 Lsr2 family protein [Corynebacterium sp. c6VSa_13]UDL73378.1 Lsr2 family protein [Corynebacterium uberis]UDL75743.1 Lsr2 family protein [Corynebacterium uberis]UDL77955.1 Lsr2 family protein [Corynebacterium uberis]UDL80239.1 Lsr2 family protein [Corynebacterium uberis]
MARKEITQYFDDLDDTPLEGNEVNVIRFGFDGTDYIIDLSSENADKFRAALAPYLKVARKHTNHASGRRNSGAARNSRAREIRQWAQDQGKNIANRGKIPSEVIEAYNQAHQ